MAGLDGLEPQGCASLTLSADRVRDVALAAVKAGGRAMVVWLLLLFVVVVVAGGSAIS